MRGDLRAARRTSANSATVLTNATRRAASILGITDAALADVLGVSASSVSRLESGRTINPESAEGERALIFLRIFRGLDAFVGDGESCKKWMNNENVHLRGVPAELIRSIEGLVHVTEYLDAMRGKV